MRQGKPAVVGHARARNPFCFEPTSRGLRVRCAPTQRHDDVSPTLVTNVEHTCACATVSHHHLRSWGAITWVGTLCKTRRLSYKRSPAGQRCVLVRSTTDVASHWTCVNSGGHLGSHELCAGWSAKGGPLTCRCLRDPHAALRAVPERKDHRSTGADHCAPWARIVVLQGSVPPPNTS